MDSTALTIIGSGASGLVSGFLSFFAQHAISRKARLSKDAASRQLLYSEFIEEASRLYIELLDGNLKQPSALVPMYSLINRIRLVGSKKVLMAAENVADEILNSCNHSTITIEDMRKIREERRIHPMHDFTAACREEREELLGPCQSGH